MRRRCFFFAAVAVGITVGAVDVPAEFAVLLFTKIISIAAATVLFADNLTDVTNTVLLAEPVILKISVGVSAGTSPNIVAE